MREIKFRAWSIAFNKMEYSGDISVTRNGRPERDSQIIVPDDTDKEKFWIIYFGDRWNVVGYSGIVMQFTGLKDKNGREIYEGDIVKLQWFHFSQSGENIAEIKWLDEVCAWNIFNAMERNLYFKNYCEESDQMEEYKENIIEVIGNVYQNPELLERK